MATETTLNRDIKRWNWAIVRLPIKFWWWSLPVYIVAGFIEYFLNPVMNLLALDLLAGVFFWLAWPVYAAAVLDELTSHLATYGLYKFGWGIAFFRLGILVPGLTAVVLGLVSGFKGRPIVSRMAFSIIAFALWLMVRAISGLLTPKGFL